MKLIVDTYYLGKDDERKINVLKDNFKIKILDEEFNMEETEKKYTIEIIKENIIKMKLEEILEIKKELEKYNDFILRIFLVDNENQIVLYNDDEIYFI
ncbi:hypothetical protein [uncultured Fusobacterium sp.]|jgi:hypothetical protein|uniref:hypothetical protein n=1 Tax=uncultured Fusobacterium sp. TaxID=159267 RepID=UPI00265DE765|nr:hypothetical protein [uncultured Fusobacterium sp.]